VVEGGKVIKVRYGGEERFQDIAEGYGRLTLVIKNHEHEEASYQVEVRINEESVKVWMEDEEMEKIGPIVLAHDEKWEQEIGFAPTEVCGSTSLASQATQGQKKLVLATTENFQANDYIQIGTPGEETAEFVQIEDIDTTMSEITIKTELKYDHSEEETVIEKHKVEFVLYKDGELYFKDKEPPHLWIDVKEDS
jgi:uncharacterized membrane protein